MGTHYNSLWNLHYSFEDPANKAEMACVENYSLEADDLVYQEGQVVDSPWGSSQVIRTECKNGHDFCLKDILIKPGHMLSLQRHRGRDEEWKVAQGVLTVIVNGARYDIPAGQSFTLSKGAVHSMINSTDKSLVVRETQKGICRENDNVRLVDFNNRPIYPITSETEFKSARLYAALQVEHVRRFGFGNLPHESLLKKSA